jgi:hypothetical protein
MLNEYVKQQILITVMTYPHPSKSMRELVCTAGINDRGEWVRLYPIDYRYRPAHQRFRKYQWIEAGLSKGGAHNDQRKESHRPDLQSIKVLGNPLPTNDKWRQRRKIIDPLPIYSRIQLQESYDIDRTSLGVVRPAEVLDLFVEKDHREWKPEWQATLKQFDLFDGAPKRLEKIPYKFSYVFRCEDSAEPHKAMIEDWEMGILFLNERERLGSEERAIESVRTNFLEKMCAPDRDTRFFMGTVWPHNSWVVIGVFWPPKDDQLELF